MRTWTDYNPETGRIRATCSTCYAAGITRPNLECAECLDRLARYRGGERICSRCGLVPAEVSA